MSSEAERTMRLALREGVFYALMLGLGEAFFLADAVRLGASPLEQGLVVALPLFVAALGPIAALRALRRNISRRGAAVAGAFLQAGCLAAAALSELTAALTPPRLIALACLHQIFGQLAGTAWSSWIGDVVPAHRRGRFFARRTRRVHVATFVGLSAGGLALELLEPAQASLGAHGPGFAVIFGLASVARLASALTFAASPEPERATLPPAGDFRTVLRSPQGAALGRVIGGAGALQLTVYVAAPFFTPFMLETLKLSYLEFTVATMLVAVGSAFALPAWGRAIDAYGAQPTFILSALLVAIVPIPWFVATAGFGVVAGAQAFSGFGWAGYEVGLFSLVLELTEPRTRPYALALLAAVTGLSQLTGALIGAASVSLGVSFATLLALTLGGRVVVAYLLPGILPAPTGRSVGRRQLLFRVIGFRPNAGIAHRAISVEDEAED